MHAICTHIVDASLIQQRFHLQSKGSSLEYLKSRRIPGATSQADLIKLPESNLAAACSCSYSDSTHVTQSRHKVYLRRAICSDMRSFAPVARRG